MTDRPLAPPGLGARARRKITRMATRQIDGVRLIDDLRRRACIAEVVSLWHELGGNQSGRPRPELRAQNSEDVLLWGLFGGAGTGFYIEAGAFDGYTLSVSYLFECVGWTGLLVEPLPDRAEACAIRRPNSRTVQSALSTPEAPREATFTRVSSDELLSYLTMTETDRNRPRREPETRDVTVTVPLSSLDAILDDHEGAIDFVSLDVEGGELDVLRGFDLGRWRPRAMLIEDRSLGADRRVSEHLRSAGYLHLVTAGVNDLYVRKGEEILVANFRAWWGDRRPFWSRTAPDAANRAGPS